MKDSLKLVAALIISFAAAIDIDQGEGEQTKQKKHHVITKQFGDPFLQRAVEGFPEDNNLALTKSFIYDPTTHHGK